MILRRAQAVILAISLILVLPLPGFAQETWDMDAWIELVTEGNRLFLEAQDVPLDDDETYRGLIRESLQFKQAAIEMLRRALLLNQIEAVAELSEYANQDLYNLTENVIVLLVDLDQCDAAQLSLQQALSDTSILPEGGSDYLDGLRPQIDECRERVAHLGVQFDYDAYNSAVADGDRWRERGEAGREIDDPFWESDLLESSQHYREAISMVENGLSAGRLEDRDGVVAAEMLELYDRLVSILFDVSACENAERRIEGAQETVAALGLEAPLYFADWPLEIEACHQRRLAAESESSGDTVIVLTEPDEVQHQLHSSSDTGVAPIILFSTSGVAAITAVTYYFLGGDDRDELNDLQAQCAVQDCDAARLEQLSSDVDDRTTITAVLSGVGVVTLLSGIVAVLTSLDSEPERTNQGEHQVGDASIGFSGTGASFRIEF